MTARTQNKIAVYGNCKNTRADKARSPANRVAVDRRVGVRCISADVTTTVTSVIDTAGVPATAVRITKAKRRVTTVLICTITHMKFNPLGYLRCYLIVYYMVIDYKKLQTIFHLYKESAKPIRCYVFAVAIDDKKFFLFWLMPLTLSHGCAIILKKHRQGDFYVFIRNALSYRAY